MITDKLPDPFKASLDQVNVNIARHLQGKPIHGRCQRCGALQEVKSVGQCEKCKAGAKWIPNKRVTPTHNPKA